MNYEIKSAITADTKEIYYDKNHNKMVYKNDLGIITPLEASVGAQGAQGPQGIQGPIGPQGIPGPVGPSGLNWQGVWSATGTYVINDTVGYNGASWFCINPVGPSALTPDLDPTNWALLAAQGAQGPQGIPGAQGPTGPAGTIIYTEGLITADTSLPGPLLTNTINRVTASATSRNVSLPQAPPIGTQVYVVNVITTDDWFISVRPNGSDLINVTSNNLNATSCLVFANETVCFTYRAGRWMADFIVGTSITFNNIRIDSSNSYLIQETLENNTTSPLSLATLNSTYGPTFPIGLKVICKNIVGGGLMYIKSGFNTWVSTPITGVV